MEIWVCLCVSGCCFGGGGDFGRCFVVDNLVDVYELLLCDDFWCGDCFDGYDFVVNCYF